MCRIHLHFTADVKHWFKQVGSLIPISAAERPEGTYLRWSKVTQTLTKFGEWGSLWKEMLIPCS